MAAQPQKPITSQFMFDSIERALELVCAIEQQQGLLPSGGVETDQYPQCCRDGPNQIFHVHCSLYSQSKIRAESHLRLASFSEAAER